MIPISAISVVELYLGVYAIGVSILGMVIVETPVFTRLIQEFMSDDEYWVIQEVLVQRPDVGDLIKGSGGLRKVRWIRQCSTSF